MDIFPAMEIFSNDFPWSQFWRKFSREYMHNFLSYLFQSFPWLVKYHTVDGSWSGEHQLRLVVCLSHYLRRVSYIPGGDRRISEPSTVVWD